MADKDQQQTVQYRDSAVPRRSIIGAYMLFLQSRTESRLLRFAPFILLGYLPIDIVDEVIPFFGFLDDIPYIILWPIVIVLTWRRVQRYR